MKKIILIIISFSCIQLNAQQSGNVSFLVGTSVPQGKISNTNYNDLSSGFAEQGINYSFQASYYFKKHWGAGLQVDFSNFGTAEKEKFGEGVLEAFEVEEATVKTGSWKLVSFLPSLTYTIPFGKFHFDIGAMAGIQSVTTPLIEVSFEDVTISQLESNANCFAAGGSLGFRYDFSKKISAKAVVNYISSKPKIDISNEGILNYADGLRVLESYNETIGMLNAGIGISFGF